MIRKIDITWAEGNLTDQEREELAELARANADMTHSVNLFKAVDDLDKRVRALEEAKGSSSTEEFPEFYFGKRYYKGDKITFNGKRYKCIAPDYAICVTSPLVFPTHWEEIK